MADQIDLDTGLIVVTGKGSGRGPRERYTIFDNKTAAALDKYMRLRAQHRLAQFPSTSGSAATRLSRSRPRASRS